MVAHNLRGPPALAPARQARWPLILAWLVLAGPCLAHEDFTAREITFSTPGAEAAGTLLLPLHAKKVPCVVIVGGTLSQTRDGGMTNRALPPRDALKRLADALAAGGYASLRYDRVGFGQSKAKSRWTGTYREEAAVAAAALRFARGRREISRVIAAGESAGAYMLCLAAKEWTQADGYIFLGGFCGPSAEMYEYNFGRLAQHAAGSAGNLAWAMKNARRDLAMGRHYREMLAAAQEGRATFEMVDASYHQSFPLARRQEELKFPPDEMFRHVRAPVLALGGARDLNVPPTHPARIVRLLHAAGNTNAVSFLVPGADHSFQRAADDATDAFRERYTFESFRRPYVPGVYQTMLAWLAQVAPSPLAETNSRPALGLRQRAVNAPERDARTETTPARLQRAPSPGTNAVGTPLPSTHLHNLFRASTNVFSGNSPDSDAAFAEIAKLGVKTVISVDGGKPDVERARKHGLRYIHLPIGYDGVPTNRVAELAKAAQSADGLLYVHCHHGLHRGPAAVAVICQSSAGWTTNQAVSWLKQAGTAADYAGLYRSAIEFRRPEAATLARIPDLPEVARTSSLVESMVAIDEEFDRLKAAQKNGWKSVPNQPDVVPAHTATILWEHFRELSRLDDTPRRPEDYRAKLVASEKASDQFRALLGDTKADSTARDAAFQALGKTCSACHKAYRN